ncbi:MAG: hypothetical protein U9R73_00790 [Pseudomonadota bacterium]|nr:hypothetical protein [Pseudomonadota bacterium]
MADGALHPQYLAEQEAAAKYAAHIVTNSIQPLIEEKLNIYSMIDPKGSTELTIVLNVVGCLYQDLIARACAAAQAGHESEVLSDLKSNLDLSWSHRTAHALAFVKEYRGRQNARS